MGQIFVAFSEYLNFSDLVHNYWQRLLCLIPAYQDGIIACMSRFESHLQCNVHMLEFVQYLNLSLGTDQK